MSTFKFVKRPYCVQVARGIPGTPIYNFLEDSITTVNDQTPFVITGTQGEQWCVSPAKLISQYQVDDATLAAIVPGQPVTVWVRDNPTPVWAELMPLQLGEFTVATSWGDMLTGNKPGVDHMFGDFKVFADLGNAPNTADCWIVNGSVFFDTYIRCKE